MRHNPTKASPRALDEDAIVDGLSTPTEAQPPQDTGHTVRKIAPSGANRIARAIHRPRDRVAHATAAAAAAGRIEEIHQASAKAETGSKGTTCIRHDVLRVSIGTSIEINRRNHGASDGGSSSPLEQIMRLQFKGDLNLNCCDLERGGPRKKENRRCLRRRH
jgi:hypothetical protein